MGLVSISIHHSRAGSQQGIHGKEGQFLAGECSQTMTRPQYGDKWYYRHLRALGGVANILMLMIANLVGFVLGLEGIQYLLGQLTGTVNGMVFTSPLITQC